MNSIVKTILLLGVLSAILITVGRLLGGMSGMYMALMFALVMNGVSYFYSDKIALKMSGAQLLAKNEHPELHTMIEELARRMQIPMPKLYMTQDMQANAFATGRDPKHASVAVTKGIMEVLSKEELKAVLAHELGHVKNRDILIASVAAVLASAISFMGNMAMFGGFGRKDDEENQGSGMLGILAIFLMPLAASLIQMAVSRQREFGADETGAKTVGTGKYLADALLKIHDSATKRPMQVNPALSSLYIGNPMGGLGGGLMKLFSTHPPVEERVARLQNIH